VCVFEKEFVLTPEWSERQKPLTVDCS